MIMHTTRRSTLVLLDWANLTLGLREEQTLNVIVTENSVRRHKY